MSDWFASTKSQLVTSYIQQHNSTQEEAERFFYEQWANATVVVPAAESLWGPILVSLNSSATGISIDTAQKIFDPDFPNSLGVPSSRLALNLSTSPATFWQSADSHFVSWFGLSEKQLNAVSSWLSRNDVQLALQQYLLESVLASRNISSIDDIPCAQWGSGAAWPDSISVSYPSLFPAAPEFYFFAKTWHQSNPGFFSIEQCRKLFYGPGNISDAKQFGDFLLDIGNALKTNNFTNPSHRWLLNLNSTFEFFAYILYTTAEYSTPNLAKRMAAGSNLMVTRPAFDWIWNYSDPLLNEFMPTAPPPSFKHNMSSAQFARENYLPSIVWSGSTNYSKILEYIQYRGYNWIDWLYPGFNMTVHGQTEDGQFSPFLKLGDRVAVFQEEYLRYFPMRAHREVTVQGIKALEFEPETKLWHPHSHYWQTIWGFANMSAQFNGTPAFFCNPHFYGVEKKWIERVVGVTPNKTRDWTKVAVEPNTGHVVNLWKGVQANMYIAEDVTWFDAYHPKVRCLICPSFILTVYQMAKGFFVPMLVGFQSAQLNPPTVQLIQSTVYLGLTVGAAGFWVFIGLSAFCALLGLLLILLTIRRVRAATFYFDRDAYERINTGE